MKGLILYAVIAILMVVSFITLRSVAPVVFPTYFIFIVLSLFSFFVFSRIDFDIVLYLSPILYGISIILLLLPIFIGEVTRGVVRWIPLGALTLQPAEIVRPFLILFFSFYMTSGRLTRTRLIKGGLLAALPLFLIVMQPSLGVAVLTTISLVGVIIATGISKRLLVYGVVGGLVAIPLLWFIMAPYQKTRVMSLISPQADPAGAGYNSIQAMISVGSGQFAGRGLGEGVQTQLAFLPERHTDFIFASIAEELGFVGAGLLIGIYIVLFVIISQLLYDARNIAARAYVSGTFMSLLAQTFVHMGMNMGLLPITGVPLPLVSAGGSSLLATMMMLGITVSACKVRKQKVK